MGEAVSGDPFFSLKAQRLSDSAVEQILGLIREGKLELGSKLPSERDLITRLSVSRSSLREAIRMLEATGVLVVLPRPRHVGPRRLSPTRQRRVALLAPGSPEGPDRDARDA